MGVSVQQVATAAAASGGSLWIQLMLMLTTASRVPGGSAYDLGPEYNLIVPRGNLSCHQCYQSVQGDSCLTMEDRGRIKVQRCASDELFCVVEKYVEDGHMATFARKCARECKEGCESAGPKAFTVQYCYIQCCQDNMCNMSAYTSGCPRIPITWWGIVMTAGVMGTVHCRL